MYARKSLLVMGSTVLTYFVGYVSWFFITNNIPKGHVGMVGSVIAFLGIMSIVTDLGLSSAHIKRISEGMDEGRCLGTYVFLKTALLVPFVALTIATISIYKAIDHQHFSDHYDEKVIYIMLVWQVLSIFSSIMVNTYLGKQKVAKAHIVLIGAALAQAGYTVAIVINSNNLYLLTSTWVVGAAMAVMIGLVLFWGSRINPPSMEYIKSYVRFAAPISFVIGVTPLILYLDKIMINFFEGEVFVASYWNAQKYAALPDAISTSIMTILFPAFSMLVAGGMLSQVRSITRKAERYLSMFVVPGAFFLMAVATPFMVIFSNQNYRDSGPIFAILMLFIIIKTLDKPYGSHFMGFNKPVYALYMTLTIVPINFILNLVFIPGSLLGIPLLGLGAMGAAIASVIGAVFHYGVQRTLSYRLIKIGINISVIKHLVASGIMACTLYLLQVYILPINRFYEVFAYAMVGGAIYILMIWLMHEFGKKEVLFILDTINLKKMASYMFSEVFDRS